jgi:hypothetical protein
MQYFVNSRIDFYELLITRQQNCMKYRSFDVLFIIISVFSILLSQNSEIIILAVVHNVYVGLIVEMYKVSEVIIFYFCKLH